MNATAIATAGARSRAESVRLPLAGALLGALSAGLALYLGQRVGTDSVAFHQGARALLAGGNPYHATATDWPNFYPLPAYLLLAPLAALPAPAFHLACASLAGLALGAAARRRPQLAPALLSAGFFQSAAEGQWAPLLLAGVALPGLAALWSAKPSLGLALFAGWPRPVAAAAGLALAVVSVVILPSWPVDWLRNLGSAPHMAPVFRPGGALLLLAWLWWRRPGARLLGTLALVPHSVAVGDALLLFALCDTKWEAYGLASLSYAAAFWAGTVVDPSLTLVEAQARQWLPVLLLCYLPALGLVLRGPRTPLAAASPLRQGESSNGQGPRQPPIAPLSIESSGGKVSPCCTWSRSW